MQTHVAVPHCSGVGDLALPMASGPAAPGQPLIPPARGCRKQGAAFSTAIPKLSAGQAREPRPRQLCPQAAGKGQEGSGGRQHFSSFITCPDPPATFLLPAPQGRGVPGPAHSCRGLLLPRTQLRASLLLPRTHLRALAQDPSQTFSNPAQDPPPLSPGMLSAHQHCVLCTQAQDWLLSSAMAPFRASVPLS